MQIKYHHRGKDYLLSAGTEKPDCPVFVVNHNDTAYYVPLVDPDDVQASDIRINHGGQTLAPLLAYADAVDICANRSLADVRDIFNSGLGKFYFKVGDYFNVTFTDEVTLYKSAQGLGGSIDANSTWRAVVIGIDHNPAIEGYNRGHFAICKNTDGVNITFTFVRLNATNTNEGGWAACELRGWLQSTFLPVLPADLRAVISPCVKYSNNTGGNANDIIATATTDTIWIMGVYEILTNPAYGSRVVSEGNFQQCYEYFVQGNTILHNRHYDPSTNGFWWLRSFSRHSTYTGMFVHSNNGGTVSGTASNRTNWCGFIPCFTIGGGSNV